MEFSLVSHCRNDQCYVQLSDGELRAKIAAAQSFLLCAAEDLALLEQALQRNASVMRIDDARRKVAGEISCGKLAQPTFRAKLEAIIGRCEFKNERLAQLIRTASGGRLQSVAGITEFDALVLVSFLRGK